MCHQIEARLKQMGHREDKKPWAGKRLIYRMYLLICYIKWYLAKFTCPCTLLISPSSYPSSFCLTRISARAASLFPSCSSCESSQLVSRSSSVSCQKAKNHEWASLTDDRHWSANLFQNWSNFSLFDFSSTCMSCGEKQICKNKKNTLRKGFLLHNKLAKLCPIIGL